MGRTQSPTSGFKNASRIITLQVLLLDDGNYSASLHSWEVGGPRRTSHYLAPMPQQGSLAPPAFEALLEAAGRALDAWFAGEIR